MSKRTKKMKEPMAGPPLGVGTVAGRGSGNSGGSGWAGGAGGVTNSGGAEGISSGVSSKVSGEGGVGNWPRSSLGIDLVWQISPAVSMDEVVAGRFFDHEVEFGFVEKTFEVGFGVSKMKAR